MPVNEAQPSYASMQFNTSIQPETRRFNEARLAIQAAIVPIQSTPSLPVFEDIAITQALDRITSADVIAPFDLPQNNNSAMDGYAFLAEDVEQYRQLDIVGSALAGHPFVAPLQAGQAVLITTGAILPKRCDSVLPHELANCMTPNTLLIEGNLIKTGQNVRRRGEELAQGHIAIEQGTRLSAAHLGLLATFGLSKIAVQRRLRVAIFSTGDELCNVPSNSQIQAPQIGVFDSNRTTLSAMLQRLHVDVVDLGVIKDDPNVLLAVCQNVAPTVDAIITSGGVAAGSADFTKQVFSQLGTMNFWSLNMRPGRPFAFGKCYGKENAPYLFGLPGNPVAMMVSFLMLVRPALGLLNGLLPNKTMQTPFVLAKSLQKIPKKIGRTDFLRGFYNMSDSGEWAVKASSDQSSSWLTSIANANCLIVLDEQQADVNVGDVVQILLFNGLL